MIVVDIRCAQNSKREVSTLRTETRERLDAILKRQRLKRLAATIAAVIAIGSAFWFVDWRQRSYTRDQLVRESHVGARVEGWHYTRAPRPGSRPLIALRLKLDDGRSVDAGSTAHEIAVIGQHVDITERHYSSGRITHVWE